LVREKQAALAPAPQRESLLTDAWKHYTNVLYGLNLREGERADPFWLKKATVAAANFKESVQDYEAVISLYQRLKSLVPALGEFCDKKINNAREKMGGK
jgi:hypothetical protein